MHIHRPRVTRFQRTPFVSNGHCSPLSRSRCTGHKCPAPDKSPVPSPREPTALSSNAPDRRQGTGQMSGALPRTAARETESLLPPDRAHRTKFPCPVLCPVLTQLSTVARVSHRTNRACHRACPVYPWHNCPVHHSSLSRSRHSQPRAPEHRTEATGQNLLSGALSGASPRLVSTCFLNALSSYLPTTMCISNVHVC